MDDKPLEPEPEIPSTSKSAFSRYPSRQKKLGPAPFASFEDLGEDASTILPTEPGKVHCRMPEIQESEAKSPEIECNQIESGRSSCGGITTPFLPASGPASGLQTPSTPRIDISCASSGTPQSESSSEKELFQCSLGLAFREDGTDDLRSSTEELVDSGPDDSSEKCKKDKEKKEKEELLRRASHPSSFFHQGKISVSPDLDEQVRKLSTHSVCLDGFHSRTARHASFGAADCSRPRAHSSLSAHSNVSGRRSSSPHKMLYETSFCGSKPIPTPSMDLDSPPSPAKTKLNSNPPPPSSQIGENCDRVRQHSDSSLSQTLEVLTETIQVHTQHVQQPTKISRSVSPDSPVFPSSPSFPPRHFASTSTATCTTDGATPGPSKKSGCNEINSSMMTEKSGADADQVRYSQGGSYSKAITSKKSSCTVESEFGCRSPHTSSKKSGCTNNLTEEEILKNEKMMLDRCSANSDADAPIETKGLFLQESQEQDDDDELPYVPTTLPMEKSVVASMVPVKQRKYEFSSTNPIQRPRCVNPPNLASINDYIVHTPVKRDPNREDKKMKINLPREDSASEIPAPPKSPKKKGPASWTDFAEMGLRSPREIRRKMKEENGATGDFCSFRNEPNSGGAIANNWDDGDTENVQKA